LLIAAENERRADAVRGVNNSQFGGEHLPVWIEHEQYRLVGACLAAARRRANLTQIQAAERLGRTQTFVSEIERGLRRVDVLEIILIARGLRANPLKLFAEIARSAERA
jgi:DNA-binding XRE family transcriptional regulator